MSDVKSKKKIIIIASIAATVVVGVIIALCLILGGKDKSADVDMELYNEAGAQIGEFLSGEEYTSLELDEKRDYAVEQLKSTEGIDPGSVVVGEQEYVFFQYTDGANGMITLEEQNEFMIGSGDTISTPIKNGVIPVEICEINTPDFGNMQTDEIYEKGKPKVLMLDAFSEEGPDVPFTKLANAWSNSHIDCTHDSDVTLDELATKMADYDMTVVFMHGGYSTNYADEQPKVSDPHLIFTKDKVNIQEHQKYKDDISDGTVLLNPGSDGKTTYVVTGDFFEKHYGQTGVLKDKIVFFGSCRSHYMGDQMMKAMGAKAVIGPTESVSNIYFYSILNDFMYCLMSGENVGESLELSESINGAHHEEYNKKFYRQAFGIEYSANNKFEDIKNPAMSQQEYDEWVKFLEECRNLNPEFRLCGDADATLVTLKSEAKTYLDEHIGSETEPEEETTQPEEEDKTALLLDAVIDNEELWKPTSDMMYYEGQTMWFQDLDFDGINELIVGGYGGGTNSLEYYNVYSLYDDTVSANQFQLDCYVQQPLLKLCKYDNSEDYFYINDKAVNSGTGIGMYYELNKYSELYLSTVVGNYEPDTETADNSAYWLNSDHEEITEAEYTEIYNSFIENLAEYSYTTDKISLSDYDVMTRDEKTERLRKSYDAFAVGEEIGAFAEYIPDSSSEEGGSTSEEAQTSVIGEYVSLSHYKSSDTVPAFYKNIDEGIQMFRDESPMLSLTASEFEIDMLDGSGGKYKGTYSLEKSGIKFNYQDRISSKNVININDPTDNFAVKAAVEKMTEMNMTGSYYEPCMPAMYLYDKSWIGLPEFFQYKTSSYKLGSHQSMILKPIDQFLCVDTYGFKLNGSYSQYSYFSIDYNFMDTMLDDSNSDYYSWSSDKREEYLETIKKYKCEYLGIDNENYNTTIYFKDGKWTWYNSENELINNGVYQESSQYPGMIEMCYSGESKHYINEGYRDYFMPLLFYIADDNSIYYPALIKK